MHNIQDFYGKQTDILRDIVLGPASDKAMPGLRFEENGMRVYDLDVLDVSIKGDLESKLVKARQAAFENTLAVQRQEQEFQLAAATAEFEKKRLELEQEAIRAREERDLAQISARTKVDTADAEARKIKEEAELLVSKLAAERSAVAADEQIRVERLRQSVRIDMLRAEVEAAVEKAKAFSPDLIAALETFGHRAVVEKAMEAVSPLAILGGTSVSDVLQKILSGTRIGEALAMGGVVPVNGAPAQLQQKS